MRIRPLGMWGALVVGCSLVLLLPPAPVLATSLKDLEEEIRALREQNERSQQRIQDLEKKVEELKGQQAKAEQAPPAPEPAHDILGRALDKYWGQNRFLITGYGFAQYQWNDNENHNTFTAGFNPVFLFRINDRLLFASELEVKLPSDAETEVNLEFAHADYILNDYLTVVAGKSNLPFGDFIEHLHPAWINKLVTNPLPFREGDEGGILPFTQLGVQLRGGASLGYGLGADVDYTAFIDNGPRYDVGNDGPMLGDSLTFNNDDLNRGKAGGLRIGIRPLPIDWNAGRWRIGASTYDGTWDDKGGLWFTSWGVDTAYEYAGAELRGEYLSTTRGLEGPVNDDREGWYVQGSYMLNQVAPTPFDRLEFVARYSGQNQRRAPEDQLPHPRQVSLGVDYWLTPSVVWKLEYDRDIPRDAPDNNELLTQFALGF